MPAVKNFNGPFITPSNVVLTFLLAFEQLNSPNVWETWMIPTRKSLPVDIFLTRRLSKSLAFCEPESINFKSWKLDYKQNIHTTIYLKTSIFKHLPSYSKGARII